MKVRDIMTTKALFDTKETDTLASAAHRMFWARCRHLPVTKGKQVVGVLSEKDVLTWQAEGHGLDGPNDRVSAGMSAPPTVAVPDEELAEAAARMIASRIDCLPVVMHGRLVGMLTTTNLLGRLVTEAFAPAARGDVPAVAVMSPRFLTALSSDPLLEAAETMVANHMRHLPVVDETGHLVGILSERDLRTALGRPRRGDHPLAFVPEQPHRWRCDDLARDLDPRRAASVAGHRDDGRRRRRSPSRGRPRKSPNRDRVLPGRPTRSQTRGMTIRVTP